MKAVLALLNLVAAGATFINFRGDFHASGTPFEVNLGCMASLVSIDDQGNFALIGGKDFTRHEVREINRRTEGGKKVKYLINNHPYHSLFVEQNHSLFPLAKLVGLERHKELFPQFIWAKESLLDFEHYETLFPNLEFTTAAGMHMEHPDYPETETHFNSVLVYHKPSKTLHVDDTFMFIDNIKVAHLFKVPQPNVLSIHPTFLRAAVKEDEDWSLQFASWMADFFLGQKGKNGEADALPFWEIDEVHTAHTATRADVEIKGVLTKQESIRQELKAALGFRAMQMSQAAQEVIRQVPEVVYKWPVAMNAEAEEMRM